MPTSSNVNNQNIDYAKKENYEVSLLNKFTIKTIEANVIPKTKVIPVGVTVGLKLHTNGVLVVGMSEIKDINNTKIKPYESSKIQEGDMIIEANGTPITSTNDLIKTVNLSNGNNVNIKYVRDDEVYVDEIKPTQTSEEEYKLGLWVRDTAAGIGTISFYDPDSKMFAALGHGIMDIDTGELLEIANGEIVTTNILSINKSQKGTPGEIRGSILNQSTLGKISKNTEIGIYGTLTNPGTLGIDLSKTIEVASRNEITLGPAKIICTLENNVRKEYDIEIQQIDLKNNENNKSMVIKITDKELLEKTNGIIQGMSGSPIIQNGKLIGAVTQVFISSPDMGYGIFADLMIKEMKES